MAWTKPLALARTTIFLLSAIGLLLGGLAHRHVPTAEQISQSVDLLEMGLTLADLCIAAGDADDGLAVGDCPACNLAGSILLPDPRVGFAEMELRVAAAILIPAHMRGFGRTTNPATPVRAPPLA